MSARILAFDRTDTVLGASLAAGWRAKGGCVLDAAMDGSLGRALAGVAPYGVVMTEPRLDEAACMVRQGQSPAVLADELQRQTMAFLADCRTAILAMMSAERGYLLALCIDDAAARIVGLPESPIANQSRAAALKSMAREYGRMGLGFNTIVCQPPREMLDGHAWRARRERLKVYALRYRPVGIDSYVRFILSLLEGDAPANGSVLCLGNGVTEMTG